jgi:hypothetical protein
MSLYRANTVVRKTQSLVVLSNLSRSGAAIRWLFMQVQSKHVSVDHEGRLANPLSKCFPHRHHNLKKI